MGFEEIFDYAAGKLDWLAHGLPGEGEEAGAPTAGGAARRDAATCRPEEPVGEVRRRVAASPHSFVVVLGPGEVVLGRLGAGALGAGPGAPAGDAAEPAPKTIRPSTRLAPLVERMRDKDLEAILVTTPGGAYLGVVRREEAEAMLDEGAGGRGR